MPVDIGDVVESLNNYMDARDKRKKAYDSCDHDASYFCYHEDHAMHEAKEVFKAKLDAYIDSRINKEDSNAE